VWVIITRFGGISVGSSENGRVMLIPSKRMRCKLIGSPYVNEGLIKIRSGSMYYISGYLALYCTGRQMYSYERAELHQHNKLTPNVRPGMPTHHYVSTVCLFATLLLECYDSSLYYVLCLVSFCILIFCAMFAPHVFTVDPPFFSFISCNHC